MSEPVDRILLLPRYSSFAGAGTFYSTPINIRAYSQAEFYFANVAQLGSPAAGIDVRVQHSPDLEIWDDLGSSLTLDTPVQVAFGRIEWIRLRITISGADPGVTCWAIGEFLRRKAG